MEIQAHLKKLHISPTKVRLVIDLIRGKDVLEAEQQLMMLRKRSALPILKLLKSAIANAENNFKLNKRNLYVKSVRANEGYKMKRWMPKAMGRATPLLKRSSMVHITLAERSAAISKQVKETKK